MPPAVRDHPQVSKAKFWQLWKKLRKLKRTIAGLCVAFALRLRPHKTGLSLKLHMGSFYSWSTQSTGFLSGAFLKGTSAVPHFMKKLPSQTSSLLLLQNLVVLGCQFTCIPAHDHVDHSCLKFDR